MSASSRSTRTRAHRWAHGPHGLEIAPPRASSRRRRGGEEDVIATLEVTDIKSEADRLREAGVNVGVVLEIPGAIRLLDVFDPDGNRIQLSEDV
jgi:predicted enzyme related to lactoylglutathione lyase